VLGDHGAVLLVNAHPIKAVPGRKTDVRDGDWICALLRHGLRKGRFMPPRPIREVRELTRHRQLVVRARAAGANRLQKLIEAAHITRGHVATNVWGLSGRLMLQARADGEEEAEQRAQLAKGKLKAKAAQLKPSLTGHLTPPQRFRLQELFRQDAQVDEARVRTTPAIQRPLHESPAPFLPQAVDRLQTIPGVGARVAETLGSELGTAMTAFPTAGHLASWAGRCPGNQQSAGKQRSGHTRQGNV
jgi:transposase